MQRTSSLAAGLAIYAAIATLATAQQPPETKREIAPGFLLRPGGVIDIGDVYVEVNYYDAKWTIAQQHDRFAPSPATQPAADAGASVISGTLTTTGGPATYTQRVSPTADGVHLTASFVSDKPLETNELSMTFILPLASFGGKEMKVDGAAVPLPLTPAKKGEARIYGNEQVSTLELPTPKGTLVVTGKFKLLLNDDREWNDPRYSLRLSFTPGSGAITRSDIDLNLALKPTK